VSSTGSICKEGGIATSRVNQEASLRDTRNPELWGVSMLHMSALSRQTSNSDERGVCACNGSKHDEANRKREVEGSRPPPPPASSLGPSLFSLRHISPLSRPVDCVALPELDLERA